MRLYILVINLIFLVFIVAVGTLSATADPADRVCVVLDAGHGGKDYGASYGGVHEKDINLGVALATGRMLADILPGIKIVYTRSDDRFVALSERCKIANRAEATLFVSIHTNANAKREAFGTETFVMGVDKAGANLGVAMRENGVISLEKDYSTTYNGYDPNSAESFIIFSLMQYSYQQSSLQLADMIQKSYTRRLNYTKNRGVKQAGFLVLWQAAMPSVLTEIGFVSNLEEAKVLKTNQGQARIANCLTESIADYLQMLSRRGGIDLPPRAMASEKSVNADLATESDLSTKGDRKPNDKAAVAFPESNRSCTDGAAAIGDGMATDDEQQIVFRVQVRTASRPLEINARNFGRYTSVTKEIKIGDLYKYFIGSRDSYKEVLILQSEVRSMFPDAFCVAFKGRAVIPMGQARKLKP